MPTVNVIQILDELEAGSTAAAERLYAEYQPLVLRVIRRHLSGNLRRLADSMDFSQIVWKSIFEHAPQLRQLNDPNVVIAHIAKIAINKVNLERRAQTTQKRDLGRTRGMSDHEADNLPIRDPSPSQTAIANERMHAISANLDSIQQIIVQRKFEGFSVSEIASELKTEHYKIRRILERISSTQSR